MTMGAERGEIAEVGSPVLVAADPIDARAPLRWTTLAIAVAALVLGLADAPAIGGWFDALPQGAFTQRLRPAVTAWERATTGLAAPHRWARARWQAARAWRFGDEQPGEQGATDAP